MQQENKPKTQNVFVIHNPVAGTSDPNQVREEIEKHLSSSGYKYQIYKTTGEENIREVVKAALKQGSQVVWAAGGDGTVSAVANGVVGEDVPIGIVPIGTGNALARELNIPLNLTAACDLLTGGHRTRVLDMLRVGDDHFVLAVSVGISALTMAETARQQKRHLGRLAYLLNGVRTILSNSLWPFKVSVDGQHFVVRASEIIAANAGIIGYKPIRWGANVRPDDGKVDLCRVRITSLRDTFSLISGFLLNHQGRLEELTCNSARDFIDIQSRKRLPVQGDGEAIGYTPLHIEVVSNILPVIVPVEEE